MFSVNIYLTPSVVAPVESVTIQDDLTGTVDEEMAIVCISTGARPAAVVEWVMVSTDDLPFEVEEETNLLVIFTDNP